MGPERDRESRHHRSGPKPKLRLVGRLDGYLDGRPVSLVAENRDLTLNVDKFSSLLTLHRNWQSVQPVLELLEWTDIRLLLRLGRLGPVLVFPRPNLLIRLIWN